MGKFVDAGGGRRLHLHCQGLGKPGILLEASGLVSSQKTGRVRTVRVEPDALASAETWLGRRRKEWEARIDRFEAHLHDIREEKAP